MFCEKFYGIKFLTKHSSSSITQYKGAVLLLIPWKTMEQGTAAFSG